MEKSKLSWVDWVTLGNPANKLKDILKTTKFNVNAHWILQQLSSFLAAELPLAKKDGKYDFQASSDRLREAVSGGGLKPRGSEHFDYVSKDMLKGMLRVINAAPRGLIFPSKAKNQLDKDFISYSRPVPLLLSALKQYREIKYSDWNWEQNAGTCMFLDDDHAAMIPYIGQPTEFTTEELLGLREMAQVIANSTKGKTRKTLEECYIIHGTLNPRFNDLPQLMKLMLLQTWAYMPQHRSKYMITDLNNLDGVAPPLVSTDVMLASNTPIAITSTYDRYEL